MADVVVTGRLSNTANKDPAHHPQMIIVQKLSNNLD